jgi:L-malate glycosyltransferase
MRILHIASGDLWAGAEAQIHTLLSHLSGKYETKVILFNDGELADRLRQTNVDVIILAESTYNSFSLFLKILSNIHHLKPDIVHTHRQKENILGSIACLFCRIFYNQKVVSLRTTHGAQEHNPSGIKRIQYWLDNIAGKKLQSKIIAVSNDLATKLESIYGHQKVVSIYNGIDINQFGNIPPSPDIHNDSNRWQIGIVGRLEKVKRIDIFLEMAKYIVSSDSNKDKFRFHVIGDGKLKSSLDAYSKELGISENVIFHGHRTDIKNCIKALHCLVMCSDHEGTPMTALESIAIGTPIVAHAVGGLKELLENTSGEGLVYDHNAECYARQVIRMTQTQNATALQLPERYSAENNANSIIELYTACLKQLHAPISKL